MKAVADATIPGDVVTTVVDATHVLSCVNGVVAAAVRQRKASQPCVLPPPRL